MNKIRISAVSYVNTFPFLYGMEQMLDKNIFQIEKDVPSKCAEKLINEEVDIGLIPVAAIPLLSDYEIIGDYCIGADGEVKSVLFASKIPFDKVRNVYLDNESRTSVNLFKVLSKNYWKKDFEYKQINGEAVSELESAVLIGDKTFDLQGFDFIYDLSEEWKKFTKMPFVFAAWVSNKSLPQEIISEFNKALGFGIKNIEASLKAYCNDLQNKDFYLDYLTNNIDYSFDNDKKLAMDKFLSYL